MFYCGLTPDRRPPQSVKKPGFCQQSYAYHPRFIHPSMTKKCTTCAIGSTSDPPRVVNTGYEEPTFVQTQVYHSRTTRLIDARVHCGNNGPGLWSVVPQDERIAIDCYSPN